MQNKEIRKRRRIFLALSLLWMVVIFYFSGQSGADSGAASGFFAEISGLPEWIIRKGAHVVEYAVLGFFLKGFFNNMPLKKPYLPAWGISVLYAAADEVHQMFSEGRTPAVGDVCIDAAGAALGVGIMCLAAAVRYKSTSKERRN